MALKAITNRITTHKAFIKIADRLTKKPAVKVNFDNATGAIVDKIGVDKELQYFTGLINFQTGQMHLIASSSHEKLAAKKGLLEDINTLMDGWYGFRLYCNYDQPDLRSMRLQVTPESVQFGGIPIEHSSLFEKNIVGLFANRAEKILFNQMKYERNLTEDKQRFWVTVLSSNDMLLVQNSFSNKGLEKWLSKSRLI
jgi:hypothetical protein